MDSSSGPALIEFEWGHRFTIIWTLVPLVILLYDHLLTLDAEVGYIWRRPKRPSFFIFIALRYVPLLCAVTSIIIGNVYIPPERCIGAGLAKVALLILQCVLVNIVLALRIYAVYNYSKIILVILLCMWLTTLFLAIWSMINETGLSHGDAADLALLDKLAGCQFPLTQYNSIRFATAWEAQGACDVLAFGLIVLRVYRQQTRVRGSILTTIVRDGALYFAIMALANLGNILMYYFGNPWISASLSWFTATISVTMMCRMMLNLHRAADHGLFRQFGQQEEDNFSVSLSPSMPLFADNLPYTSRRMQPDDGLDESQYQSFRLELVKGNAPD